MRSRLPSSLGDSIELVTTFTRRIPADEFMNPLTKKILATPSMWAGAAQVTIAKIMRRPEVIVRRAGLSVACGTGNGQGSFCAIAGTSYEPELLWLLDQLQPGDTFVDVGANIGIYSLHAAPLVKGSGKVFAIEPSPDAFRLLKRNLALNGLADTVVPLHAAASRKEGRLYLSGTVKKWNSLQLHENPPGMPVDVTTVDAVLERAGKRCNFHFLKIDAEGVETDVLDGARVSIETSWPTIIFENAINRSKELPTQWLRGKGYNIFAIDRRGQLIAVAPDGYARHTNLVAVHPSSRKTAG